MPAPKVVIPLSIDLQPDLAGDRTTLYMIVTQGDNRVCDICDAISKQSFTSEKFPDEDIPPIHPNCRCEIETTLEVVRNGETLRFTLKKLLNVEDAALSETTIEFPDEYGFRMRSFTMNEKLEWLQPGALQRLKEFNKQQGPGKFYYIKAIHPTISGNYREYTADELTRFARTLIGKNGDINHGEHLTNVTVIDSEYSNKEKAVELVVYSENAQINQLYQNRQIVGASIEAEPRFSTTSENGLLQTPQGLVGRGIAFVTVGETPGDPTTEVTLIETVKKKQAEEAAANMSSPNLFPAKGASAAAPKVPPAVMPPGTGKPAMDPNAPIPPEQKACIDSLVAQGLQQADAATLCAQIVAPDPNNPNPAGQPPGTPGAVKQIKQFTRADLAAMPKEKLELLAIEVRIRESLNEEFDEYKKRLDAMSIAAAAKTMADMQALQQTIATLQPFMPPAGEGAPTNYTEMKEQWKKEAIGEFKVIRIQENKNGSVRETVTVPLDPIDTLPPEQRVQLALRGYSLQEVYDATHP